MKSKVKPKNTSVYRIEGLNCPDCAEAIQKGVARLPEVKDADVDYLSSQLKVTSETESKQTEEIIRTIRRLGYDAKRHDNLTHSTLLVIGMDCPEESTPIESHLRSIDGVEEIGFNLLENKLFLTHSIPLESIRNELRSIGFESELQSEVGAEPPRSFWQKHKSLALVIITGLLAVAGTVITNLQVDSGLAIPIFLLAIVIGGYPISRKGITEARHLRLGINFLMSIAVIGAMILGEWSEAAMVVFLFSLANYLEARSMTRARRSIRSLMDLAPETATVQSKEGIVTKAAESVEIGEVIVAKPGDRLPLDGVVKQGKSRINQAPLTGESVPVEKQEGDEVFAGTINEYGSLLVEVTKKYQDSALSRVVKLVEEAQAKKAPTQAFVEKFSYYYTPAVVILAGLLAVVPPLILNAPFQEWFYRALVLLVISCPCALVISTPVAIVSGLTNAARHGILIKGGVYLEEFGRIRAIALDKTGTITEGRPRVVQTLPMNGMSDAQLLTLAASVEARSEHPLSRAVVEEARHRKLRLLPVDHFEALPGKGLKARVDGDEIIVGNHALFEELELCDSAVHAELEKIENANHTAILVANGTSMLGIVSVADSVRANARSAFQELHKAGIRKLVMLTGDNHRTAAAITDETGIDESHAELLPQEKVEAIEKLKERYGKIAMVGDGINDAPALAAATIGASMGATGTNAALETADIALMKDDLSKLPYLKRLSRYTVRNIKENIFLALGIKAVFLMLAIPGLATLWMAVVADMGASLLVVFNGLRVLRFGND
jgi:Cd2+/Zn2+-exporting ATPase